jgi:hypothetical protein
MKPAEKLTTTISDPLTWAEICERFPNQEVCLVEVDYCHVEIDAAHPNGLEIRTARVVGHGKRLEEAMDQAERWREHYEEILWDSTRRDRFQHARPRLIFYDYDETRDSIRGPRR